jgi:hypothetical protein
MASSNIALIATASSIYGLGRLAETHDPSAQDAFEVNFTDHYTWDIKCGANVLMRSRYGEPSLPTTRSSRDRFLDTYCRLFIEASPTDADHVWDLILLHVAEAEGGASIIVATDAESEPSLDIRVLIRSTHDVSRAWKSPLASR